MKIKKFIISMLLSVLMIGSMCAPAFACTTVIVGKDASADGNAIMGRSDDSEGCAVSTIVTIPAEEGEGTYTFEDLTNGFTMELPVEHCQYFMTPELNVPAPGEYDECGGNEYGVYISATESIYPNEAAIAADPFVENSVAETNIIPLVLPYIKTAREGVLRLGEIIEQYGSAEGNGVIFGDSDEIWYMEIYTGHQWAAVRCPDDQYAVIGNAALIGYIDTTDTENVLACDTIYSFAEENGFLQEVDGKPHLTATYSEVLNNYAQIRVWAGRKTFAPSTVGDYDVNQRFDIFETPDEKIALADVMDLTRYRYEDTPYSCDIEGNNYRPIGIERTATAHLIQLREDKPSVAWVTLANPEFSVYMPLYENLNSVPEAFESYATEYTPDSAYWQFRAVSSLATLDRQSYGTMVRDAYKALELKWIDNLDEMDEEYLTSGQSPEKAAQLFATVSAEALDTAESLQGQLLTQISLDVTNASDVYGTDEGEVDPTAGEQSSETDQLSLLLDYIQKLLVELGIDRK